MIKIKTPKKILEESKKIILNISIPYIKNKLQNDFKKSLNLLLKILKDNPLSNINFKNQSEKKTIESLYNSINTLSNSFNSILNKNSNPQSLNRATNMIKIYILNLNINEEKSKSWVKKIFG